MRSMASAITASHIKIAFCTGFSLGTTAPQWAQLVTPGATSRAQAGQARVLTDTSHHRWRPMRHLAVLMEHG